MDRLAGGGALLALLDCLRETYAFRGLAAFPASVVSALPKVSGSDITVYNEIRPHGGSNTMAVDTLGEVFPGSKAIFAHHIPEHPSINYYKRPRASHAVKISDFVTRTQFHRLGLYNEFFRRLGVEHQMAFTLEALPSHIIGIALNRGRPDFTEHDRLLLNLLRPHLIPAYR